MNSVDRQWFIPFARAGYFSRGVVYLIIGSFAVLASLDGGQKTGTKGALERLLQQPLGELLVWLMIVGLVGYVLWRLIQSLFDTDGHGWTPKGLAVRSGLLASAFTYMTLTTFALDLIGILPSSESQSGDSSISDIIAGFIGKAYVALLLAIVFAGVAGAHWYKAITQKYANHFDVREAVMPYIHIVSFVGLVARGLAFAIISLLLMYRFLKAETQKTETPGIKDVMNFIHDLPGGNIMLLAFGIGITLFAGYSFAQSYWRRINIHDA